MKDFKEFIAEGTWYRGHKKGETVSQSKSKIMWISQSKGHASGYAGQFGANQGEVSEVDFNAKKNERYTFAVIDINRTGEIKDIIDGIGHNYGHSSNDNPPKPETDATNKLKQAALDHFSNKRLTLDKFFYKVGSEKLIAWLKSLGYKYIHTDESGIQTIGIIK
jgi:hypothetical protein